MNDGAVVRIEGITKEYLAGEASVHALQGVSFEVHRAEMVAIMGPSGSGKTTLLNMLGCVDRPTSGRYWLDGTDVSELHDGALSGIRNEKIGFVFQTFNLLPRLTAEENVRLPMLYSSRRQAPGAAFDVLERVGLADRAHHRPNQLSGGQQQRVAIARALIMSPAILLADEPTGNLDSRSGEEILAIFQRLNQDGVTIILVTHDPTVAHHSTRSIMMRDGRIQSDEPVANRVFAQSLLTQRPAREEAAA
jgi:putative ABC transport system ATP-binding protein